MIRHISLFLLGAAVASAQEDGGISVDEKPSGPEPPPATAAPARRPGAEVGTVEIRRKGHSFSIPADWVLLEDEDARTELTWKVLFPGSRAQGTLRLFGDEGDPRSAPYDYAQRIRRGSPDAIVEPSTKPVSKVVARYPGKEGDWINCDVFFVRKNRMYFLQLGCSVRDFETAERDLLAAAQSFATEADGSPIPKGYRVARDGIWLIARAPSVAAPVAALGKALDDAERRFKRMHGALPKADEPFVVLLHASTSEAASFEPRAADFDEGFFPDLWRRRLFAIPFDGDDVDRRGRFAEAAHRLLLAAKYGDDRPAWIWVGESTIARAEACLGKPLPSLDDGFFGWFEDVKLHRLGDLDALRRLDSEAWGKETLFHVAALREGKYAKEYRAFLADIEETGDALGALDRHLGKLDPEQVVAAANDYVKTKVKPEEREEKRRKKKG